MGDPEKDPACGAFAPDYSTMPVLVKIAVDIALAEHARGVKEAPLGSNRGPDVDCYLRGRRGDGVWLLDIDGHGKGASWCGRFALWCVEGAAMQLGGVPPPTAGAGGLASALKWGDWAASERRARKTPAPGNVGLIRHGVHGHVVLVIRVDGDSVISVEGNSADAVRVVRRPTSRFDSFVDLS